MCRVACSKLSYRKRNERTSCKVGCDGDSERRAPDVGDVSDVESEEIEVEEVAGEDVVEERLLRAVVKLGDRENIDIPMYEGNLDAEELIDWI
jgi:hypothetical protein